MTLARQVEVQLALRLELQQVARLGLELAREHDAVVRLERQKRDLVGLVVHDLKNPLTCILAETSFLRECELPADAADALRSIAAAAKAMHRMTLDMLDISRREDGELRLRNAPLDLDAVMMESRDRAAQRGARSRSCRCAAPCRSRATAI